MKKLFISLIFLLSFVFIKAQDTRPAPTSPVTFISPLTSYTLAYDKADSTVWIWKGALYGWTKLAGDLRHWWTLLTIDATGADTVFTRISNRDSVSMALYRLIIDTTRLKGTATVFDLRSYTLKNDSSKYYEKLTNKVTSISGASTDVQYGSAKLLYDQLALKAPVSVYPATGLTTGYIPYKSATVLANSNAIYDGANVFQLSSAAPTLLIRPTNSANDAMIDLNWAGASSLRLRYNPDIAMSYIETTYAPYAGRIYGDIAFRTDALGTPKTLLYLSNYNDAIGIGTSIATGAKLVLATPSGAAFAPLIYLREGDLDYGFKFLQDDAASGNMRIDRIVNGDASSVLTFSRADGNVSATTSLTTPTINIITGAAVGKAWLCTNAITGAGQWTTFTTTETYMGTVDGDDGTINGGATVLVDGTGTAGYFYRCIDAGTFNYDVAHTGHPVTLAVGDDIIYNGTIWQLIPAPIITGNALTKTDDTNITLTLGGSPATSLLNAASITAGWTGTLADSRIASAATWNAKAPLASPSFTGIISLGYLSIGQEGGGLYFEQAGTSTSNENIRLQSSKSGDATNYSQFIIDPTDGFSFGHIGTGNSNLSVDGIISATGGTSTDWNEAHGWGNHASAGYGLASALTTHANLTTTAHGLGASAFHADNFFATAAQANATHTGDVTGATALTLATVTVPKGGTGLTTLTDEAIMIGNGTATPTFVAPSTAGNVLTSYNGAWASRTPAGGGMVYPSGTGVAVVTSGTSWGTTLGYASANTASALVQRDVSGNFTAGTMTGSITGNAGTVTVAANTDNATYYPLFSTSATGSLAPKTTAAKLTFNPSTGILVSTNFQASDIRLKKNINPIDFKGLKTDKVQWIQYIKKDDKTNTLHYGVSAQKLEKIFPLMVNTATDSLKTKSVNYTELLILKMATLEVKQAEMQQEIKVLQNKVNTLERKYNRRKNEN